MIATRLLLIFSIAATAWADSNSSWIFFVKINETFFPLSASRLEFINKDLSMFTYGDPSNYPEEFTREGNHVYTKYKAYQEAVGFYSDDLMLGPYLFAAPLNIDKRGRVLNGPFYSCDLDIVPSRGIVRSFPPDLAPRCFEVEIYIFSYDRETGSAVNPVPPGSPWVFFAKVNDTFAPLSEICIGNKKSHYCSFIYGNPSGIPAEFALDNGYAFTIQKFERLGFCEGDMVFGHDINPIKLDVDEKGRVLNGYFHSCNFSKMMDGPVRGILSIVPTKLKPHCFDVDIYLLPYDKETKSAVQTIVVEDRGRVLAEYDKSEKSIDEPCGINFQGSRKAFDDFFRYYKGYCTVYHNGKLF